MTIGRRMRKPRAGRKSKGTWYWGGRMVLPILTGYVYQVHLPQTCKSRDEEISVRRAQARDVVICRLRLASRAARPVFAIIDVVETRRLYFCGVVEHAQTSGERWFAVLLAHFIGDRKQSGPRRGAYAGATGADPSNERSQWNAVVHSDSRIGITDKSDVRRAARELRVVGNRVGNLVRRLGFKCTQTTPTGLRCILTPPRLLV